MEIIIWFVQYVKRFLVGTPKREIERENVSEAVVLKFKNNSDRLSREYDDLMNVNRPLANLVLDVLGYISLHFGKDTTVTMIYRTQSEQESIYGEGYAKKSPHQFNHAVDIRSRDLTDNEIVELVTYLNDTYNESNYYKWTAKNHEVNNHGIHFHIQYYEV